MTAHRGSHLGSFLDPWWRAQFIRAVAGLLKLGYPAAEIRELLERELAEHVKKPGPG